MATRTISQTVTECDSCKQVIANGSINFRRQDICGTCLAQMLAAWKEKYGQHDEPEDGTERQIGVYDG